jgi:hypothetical protein
MKRAATWTALVALGLLAGPAAAAIMLELRVDSELRADLAVHVVVKNIGDEPAEGALPELTLAGTTVHAADPASLPTGFTAVWDLTMPRPTALGTLPLVVQLHYADGFGHQMSAPAVHVVRTAGNPSGAVSLAVEATSVGDEGTATIRLANPEATRVAGTLALVASAELAVTPAERPIEMAAGGTLTVPVRIENRSAIPGSTAALWAYVTLERGASIETLVASAALPIGPGAAEQSRPSEMILPLAAVGAAAILLWGVRRLLAPARVPRSRADRRRRRTG